MNRERGIYKRTVLIQAAEEEHMEILTKMIDDGADVNHVSSYDGESALTLACARGHKKAAAVLLSNGADREHANHDGETPLMLSAIGGHYDIARALIRLKVNTEYQNPKTGETALSAATRANQLRCILLLLACGANINGGDGSPLMEAALYGYHLLVKTLIKHGADLMHQDSRGDTALTCAAMNGYIYVAATLIRHAKHNRAAMVNHRTHDGRTPLIAACLSGHTEMAALLISHGAELDSDLDQTMSPLFCAAEEGHTRTTQLLLSRGADPHRALKGGATPLMIASLLGHTKIVTLLLNYETVEEPDLNPEPDFSDEEPQPPEKPTAAGGKNGDCFYGNKDIEFGNGIHHKSNDDAENNVDAVVGGNAVKEDVSDNATETFNISKAGKDSIDDRDESDSDYELLKSAETDSEAEDDEWELVRDSDCEDIPEQPACPRRTERVRKRRVIKQAYGDELFALGGIPAEDLLPESDEEEELDIQYRLAEGRLLLDGIRKDLEEYLAGEAEYGRRIAEQRESTKDPHCDVILELNREGARLKTVHDQLERRLREFGEKARENHIRMVGPAPVIRPPPMGLAARRIAITKEALVSVVTAKGDTPLHLAAGAGHHAVVEHLLISGAHSEEYNRSGHLPLHLAASAGHTDVVQVLLSYRASVDGVTKRGGDTALGLAAHSGFMDTMITLINNGANPNHLNDSCFTPMSLAAQHGHEGAIRVLLELRGDVNGQAVEKMSFAQEMDPAAPQNVTPLMVAAYNGRTEVVRLLLGFGAKVNIRATQNKVNALNLACRKGHLQVADVLLSHPGTKSKVIENCARKGVTPLMEAAFIGNLELGTLLLDRGAGINTESAVQHDTALHAAADAGMVDFAEMLIKRGARVDAKNKSGRTPLSLAAQNGFVSLATLLLEKGASVHSQDAADVSVLKHAYRNAQVEMTEFLLKKGARLPNNASDDLKLCIDQSKADPKKAYLQSRFEKIRAFVLTAAKKSRKKGQHQEEQKKQTEEERKAAEARAQQAFEDLLREETGGGGGQKGAGGGQKGAGGGQKGAGGGQKGGSGGGQKGGGKKKNKKNGKDAKAATRAKSRAGAGSDEAANYGSDSADEDVSMDAITGETVRRNDPRKSPASKAQRHTVPVVNVSTSQGKRQPHEQKQTQQQQQSAKPQSPKKQQQRQPQKHQHVPQQKQQGQQQQPGHQQKQQVQQKQDQHPENRQSPQKQPQSHQKQQAQEQNPTPSSQQRHHPQKQQQSQQQQPVAGRGRAASRGRSRGRDTPAVGEARGASVASSRGSSARGASSAGSRGSSVSSAGRRSSRPAQGAARPDGGIRMRWDFFTRGFEPIPDPDKIPGLRPRRPTTAPVAPLVSALRPDSPAGDSAGSAGGSTERSSGVQGPDRRQTDTAGGEKVTNSRRPGTGGISADNSGAAQKSVETGATPPQTTNAKTTSDGAAQEPPSAGVEDLLSLDQPLHLLAWLSSVRLAKVPGMERDLPWPPPRTSDSDRPPVVTSSREEIGQAGGDAIPCYPGFSCHDADAIVRYYRWPESMAKDPKWLSQYTSVMKMVRNIYAQLQSHEKANASMSIQYMQYMFLHHSYVYAQGVRMKLRKERRRHLGMTAALKQTDASRPKRDRSSGPAKWTNQGARLHNKLKRRTVRRTVRYAHKLLSAERAARYTTKTTLMTTHRHHARWLRRRRTQARAVYKGQRDKRALPEEQDSDVSYSPCDETEVSETSPSPKRPAIEVDLGLLDLGLGDPGSSARRGPERYGVCPFSAVTRGDGPGRDPWPLSLQEEEEEEEMEDSWPLQEQRRDPGPIERPRWRDPWPLSSQEQQEQDQEQDEEFCPMPERQQSRLLENQQLQMRQLQQQLDLYDQERRLQQLRREQLLQQQEQLRQQELLNIRDQQQKQEQPPERQPNLVEELQHGHQGEMQAKQQERELDQVRQQEMLRHQEHARLLELGKLKEEAGRQGLAMPQGREGQEEQFLQPQQQQDRWSVCGEARERQQQRRRCYLLSQQLCQQPAEQAEPSSLEQQQQQQRDRLADVEPLWELPTPQLSPEPREDPDPQQQQLPLPVFLPQELLHPALRQQALPYPAPPQPAPQRWEFEHPALLPPPFLGAPPPPALPLQLGGFQQLLHQLPPEFQHPVPQQPRRGRRSWPQQRPRNPPEFPGPRQQPPRA